LRICIIGTGYVGLVSGACFSELGTQVVCVDTDRDKLACLERGEVGIFEPGLDELVARNVAAKRLSFTGDLSVALPGCAAVFIAVGTPSRRGDGHADLSYVFAAAEQLARNLVEPAVVVTKSTVPVGTGREILAIMRQVRGRDDIAVVSNPEFLREGSAIGDFMRPNRVVIGTNCERGREVMRTLYRPLYLNETPIVFTSLETAELTKYAANAFLATKVTFINEIAGLCEKVGADVQHVARGIGLDGRIGDKFLHPGPGFGGSCFPKDTFALMRTAREVGSPVRIVETVAEVNEQHKRAMVDKIIAHCGGSLDGLTIAVLGLTFKPNTDDMRESPALVIVPGLIAAGARVRAFDPKGMGEARKLLDGIAWCVDPYDAMRGADCLVLLTEWNEFRNLDFARTKTLMRQPSVVDLRNIYTPDEMADAGIRYTSVGQVTFREGFKQTASLPPAGWPSEPDSNGLEDSKALPGDGAQ